MGDLVNKIAVVQGAPARRPGTVQLVAERWLPSLRLAGVVAEDHGLADRACSAGYLRSLRSGERFQIFQDLPGIVRLRWCRAIQNATWPITPALTQD